MNIFDELSHGINTSSAEAMEAIGERLGKALPDNCRIALHGDLGSGKTTFMRGLARGMGIDAAITSPTYNIYSIYQGTRQLLHMDAYRIASAAELDTLCIEEFLRPPYLIAIEWPENVGDFMDDLPTFVLHFSILPDEQHHVVLKGPYSHITD